MSSFSRTTMDPSLTLSQPPSCFLIQDLPLELHVNILTYLRAYDLSSVQLLCRFFANPNLTHAIVHHTAHYVYPPELTKGFLPQQEEEQRMTYQALRSMELLVVARVLNRPEPKHGGYYVSKSWCKTALRWLEVQQEQQQQQQQQQAPIKKKLSKKQLRIRKRRLSDASPPWQNVNSDICCAHSNLQKANSKAVRSRRKVLDKQAWKVLKKLYPDSTQLELARGECLLCCVEQETQRRNELDKAEKAKAQRREPLSCPLTRGIYTRSRGVPLSSLVVQDTTVAAAAAASHNKKASGPCPLKPGLYHVLPRAWCHAWRRYMKQGGDEPCAPNATALLCDAHKLPLIPPHLESFLCGETNVLLSSSSSSSSSSVTSADVSNVATLHDASSASVATSSVSQVPPVGLNPIMVGPQQQQQQRRVEGLIDHDMMSSLYASGMTAAEVASQRMAMMSLEQDQTTNAAPFAPLQQQAHQQHQAQESSSSSMLLSPGELLDRENKVVVEILTQDEYTALEQWWPKSHLNFSLRFGIMNDNDDVCGSIEWSTAPCRECDASRHYGRQDLLIRNRARGWVAAATNNNKKKKKSSSNNHRKSSFPASLEY